jgi:SpoVK/Ycf46/Vps4 family AAA+-type ATPase
MDLVFIYGSPGVGKLTVATEISRLTGYKLFHNHVSLNAVLPVFSFGSESQNKLVREIRVMVLAEAAKQDVDVIFTFVYAHDEDIPLVDELCAPVERAGGRVLFVQLTCSQEEIERRVVSAERAAMSKISSVDRLRRTSERWDMSKAERESLVIDNTEMAAVDVARRIGEHYGLSVVAT